MRNLSFEEFLVQLPELCKEGGQQLAPSLLKAGGMSHLKRQNALMARLEFRVQGQDVAIVIALGCEKRK